MPRHLLDWWERRNVAETIDDASESSEERSQSEHPSYRPKPYSIDHMHQQYTSAWDSDEFGNDCFTFWSSLCEPHFHKCDGYDAKLQGSTTSFDDVAQIIMEQTAGNDIWEVDKLFWRLF
mmetsp:Transcript_2240/g.5034  ORF Transcript_2240/g.5034 Transcript_2240/m.5034 type:complete len:120 (-) Transcript_2240:1711-2070(-)